MDARNIDIGAEPEPVRLKLKQIKVEPIFQCPVCDECCGEVTEAFGNLLMSSPVQRDFACSSCEKVFRLQEGEFPGVKFKLIRDSDEVVHTCDNCGESKADRDECLCSKCREGGQK